MLRYCIIVQCILAASTADHNGFGPGRQDWGLAKVRQGAHMFWWLYYVTNPGADHYTDRPIVIWLQGGPGASSSGYGNFEEIGPLDLDLHERSHTWVKYCNILFVDNPVGSGFSYVDDPSLLAKDNDQIAQDLVTLMKQFYRLFPEFHKTPLHIFSESYGGKMAVEFAYQLDRAIKEGSIDCNLRSVALGAPWISPEDSVLAWGEFLLNLGFVDTKGYSVIQKAAEGIQDLIRINKTRAATEIWRSMQQLVTNETVGIDCYNVLTPQEFTSKALVKNDDEILEFSEDGHPSLRVARSMDSTDKLKLLMRGPVAASLGIPSRALWGSQKDKVFEALYEDFMKPATKTVELLLNNTNVNVIVYTGQLDLVVCTPGTVRWVEKLQWPGSVEYLNAPRTGMGYLGVLEGYAKCYDRLSMYWINRSGHMAPVDNHMAMQYILDKHVRA
ncbi:retinoid-inducible serine carboxypeptidase-like [Ochlerotatus camptorhynchus]|uniref:retinoid-inducible serine carboxypeptidase-like n=1 Tax=Ochlerotatus camptorhynchus TaxID=644619 RepID=UPI0031D75789